MFFLVIRGENISGLSGELDRGGGVENTNTTRYEDLYGYDNN